MVLLDASLDTSFWVMAAQLGVVPYLFAFFRVHYCKVVEQEIITTDPDETPLIYPQAMLFMVMKESGRLQQAEPKRPLDLFGTGEAHAIALARERSWALLINDSRPLRYAETLDIACVSVPDFCVLLFSQKRITLAAARGYLHRLGPTTSRGLLDRAERLLKRIASDRGELT